MGNFLGLGLLSQGKKALTNKLYEQYGHRLDNAENFQNAIIDIFNVINASMLGTHFGPPDRQEVKDFHMNWLKESDTTKKKELFAELINKVLSKKTSSIVMLVGVGAPPAAMLAKRAGENFPGINKIRLIPDYVFVPTATLVALSGLKFLQFNVKQQI